MHSRLMQPPFPAGMRYPLRPRASCIRPTAQAYASTHASAFSSRHAVSFTASRILHSAIMHKRPRRSSLRPPIGRHVFATHEISPAGMCYPLRPRASSWHAVSFTASRIQHSASMYSVNDDHHCVRQIGRHASTHEAAKFLLPACAILYGLAQPAFGQRAQAYASIHASAKFLRAGMRYSVGPSHPAFWPRPMMPPTDVLR
jgi:hypothetical protein